VRVRDQETWRVGCVLTSERRGKGNSHHGPPSRTVFYKVGCANGIVSSLSRHKMTSRLLAPLIVRKCLPIAEAPSTGTEFVHPDIQSKRYDTASLSLKQEKRGLLYSSRQIGCSDSFHTIVSFNEGVNAK
jgi:hypothetical protein